MLKQSSANIQERKELKNGTVLYTVLGSKGYTYYITVKNGEIDPETHQDCDGFHFCGHCYHTRDINAMESEIAAEKKMAAHEAKMSEQYASDPRPQGLAETYLKGWYPKSDRY